jgi:hypothetical protein
MEMSLSRSLSDMIRQLSDSVKTSPPERAAYHSRILASITRLRRQVEDGGLRKLPLEKIEEFRNLLISLQRALREDLQRSELYTINEQLMGLSSVIALGPISDE